MIITVSLLALDFLLQTVLRGNLIFEQLDQLFFHFFFSKSFNFCQLVSSNGVLQGNNLLLNQLADHVLELLESLPVLLDLAVSEIVLQQLAYHFILFLKNI